MRIDEEIRELDSMFSEIVRRREADSNGYVPCITCGKRHHWKDLDCGHYIGRRHTLTRYDDRNCHPQCISCNRFNYGEEELYRNKLIEMYGIEAVEELERCKNKSYKFDKVEKEQLKEKFKQELLNI